MNGFLLTKILAVTDGSQHAVLAAHAATDLSPRARAQLYVVHVWQEPRLAMTLPAVATDECSQAFTGVRAGDREARDLLQEQADRVRGTRATVWRNSATCQRGLRGKRVREAVDASRSVG